MLIVRLPLGNERVLYALPRGVSRSEENTVEEEQSVDCPCLSPLLVLFPSSNSTKSYSSMDQQRVIRVEKGKKDR